MALKIPRNSDFRQSFNHSSEELCAHVQILADSFQFHTLYSSSRLYLNEDEIVSAAKDH